MILRFDIGHKAREAKQMIEHNHQNDLIYQFDVELPSLFKWIHTDKGDYVETLEERDELDLLAWHSQERWNQDENQFTQQEVREVEYAILVSLQVHTWIQSLDSLLLRFLVQLISPLEKEVHQVKRNESLNTEDHCPNTDLSSVNCITSSQSESDLFASGDARLEP